MRALRRTLFAGAVVVYTLLLAPAAAVGAWVVRLAQRADVRLDAWRYAFQRHDARVASLVDQVAYAIRQGATAGSFTYEYLNERDLDRLARAIDNCGCYVQAWSRRLTWTRRDRHPTGETLSLAALPPADRDAWADAIANLDGEGA